MSFQPKSFSLQRDAGCLAGENMGYENPPRIEPKRSHQWFMNTGEPEIYGNKKQAVEAVSGRPFLGVSHVNAPPWDTNSGFHSVTGQFSDRLFGLDLGRSVNLVDKNMPSIGSGNVNVGRKDFENQYDNDPSMGLSRSHPISDHSSYLNFGGIRKVNQVRNSDNCFTASIGRSYSTAYNSTISMGAGYNKNDGNISLGSAYNNGNVNTIAMGTGIGRTDDNHVSMGHPFNKGNGSFMLMGHNYGKGDKSVLSMIQPFNREDFIFMDQSYEKGDSNLRSLGSSYTKGHEGFISMATYSKSGENLIHIAPSYDKGTDHLISMGPTYNKVDSNITPTVPSYDRGDSSSLPVGHNYNKGDSSTISFGAFHDNTDPNSSDGIINGYNLLMGNQLLAQGFDSHKDVTKSNSEPPVTVNSIPKPNAENDATKKKKEPKKPKKAALNNFPSNVKSLLSTGIFDGVPVKYVSWSREKNLGAFIKGTGYLCLCDECKQSKALNAYEFERHAGGKTKHPNNHIYFENGKTVYAIVQELKNTPQEMLFDAIQNVTGSPVNQKNFNIWKASYQAATKELQRIYGQDEAIVSGQDEATAFAPAQSEVITPA